MLRRLDDVSEYSRRMDMAAYLFGGTPGEIVSFGNDDSYQLAQKYPTFFVKSERRNTLPNLSEKHHSRKCGALPPGDYIR
jgi:hypothetical protein